MSVAVDLDELAGEVERRGFGYLLTTGADGRPKAVAVVPTVDGGRLRFTAGVGGGTARNVAERSAVSVVFPPVDGDAFSLLVDGDATVEADGDAVTVVVSPTWAVRHRPAPGA